MEQSSKQPRGNRGGRARRSGSAHPISEHAVVPLSDRSTPEGLLRFGRLAMMYTDPLYWSSDPIQKAKALHDFLKAFLADQEGNAWLGVNHEGNIARWLQGIDALQWVDVTYSRIWHPLSSRLAQGTISPMEAFHELVERRATLFMDKSRFLSVYGKTHQREQITQLSEQLEKLRELVSGHDELSHEAQWIQLNELLKLAFDPDLQNIESDYYIGFHIDWAYVNQLMFMPQLRIANFWFENRALAPERPQGLADPALLTPEEASELEEVYWKRIETAFKQVRHQYGLGSVNVRVADAKWLPPVFYYVEPQYIPQQPAMYFTEAPFVGSVAAIARPLLEAHDIFSSDVSGGLLWGSLVTLRREVTIPEKATQSFYLVLPWYRSNQRQSEIIEVERELMFVADKCSFIEFESGYRAHDALTDLERQIPRVAIWGGNASEVALVARLLHNELVLAQGEERRRIFRLARMLSSSLARAETEILRVASAVAAAERSVKESIQNASRLAKIALHASPVHEKMRWILDEISNFFPFRRVSESTNLFSARMKELTETQQRIKSAIHDIFEQERREQEAAERALREEQDRHLQRQLALQQENERRIRMRLELLAIAFAALAAFPLLIGQLDNDAIIRSLKRLGWIQGVADWLQELHPVLTLIAVLVAVILLVVSSFLFFRSFCSYCWRRICKSRLAEAADSLTADSELVSESDEVDFLSTRKQIAEAWRLTAKSVQLVNLLQMTSDSPSRHICEKLDRLDTQVSEKLCEVWEWLSRSKAQVNQEDAMDDWMKWLQRVVHTAVVKMELLDGRPETVGLIRSLCLLRYKSQDFLSRSVISDWEFRAVLKAYGYSDIDVMIVDQLATKLCHLPAPEFVEKLRNYGVDACHSAETEQLLSALLVVCRDYGDSQIDAAQLMEELRRRLAELENDRHNEEGGAENQQRLGGG